MPCFVFRDSTKALKPKAASCHCDHCKHHLVVAGQYDLCVNVLLVWLQDRRDFFKFQQYVIMTRVYTDPLQQQTEAAAAARKLPAGPSKQPKKQKGEHQQQQVRALTLFDASVQFVELMAAVVTEPCL